MHDDSTEAAVLGRYLIRRSVNATALERYAAVNRRSAVPENATETAIVTTR
jgi:hypothetical protein